MARKLIVELAGDSRSLERTFKRGSTAARGFGKDMDRTFRGVVAGSGAFRALGRSVAFASASFIGGAGIVAAVKSTIAAAAKSQAVLGQTEVAVRNAGQSWSQYGKQIEATALAQSRLSAFEDERLLGTFSNLVRRTGDVRKAMRLNALAADVARGRNIALEAATQIVIKASLGMAGALRRVGLAAKNGASGTQLLQLLQAKYAGAAAAYGRTAAGAQERFRNAIENVQEALGKKLLPRLTQVLEKAADWLDSSKNQEKVVDVVTGAVQGLVGALKAMFTLLRPLISLAVRFADAVGGWGKAIKIAAIAWVGFKAKAIIAARVALVSNVLAARGTAAAWRAALASTGWGVFVIAASIAAEKIMDNWEHVRLYFKNFFLEFALRANQAALAVARAFNFVGKHLKIYVPGLGTKNLIPGADKLQDAVDLLAGNVRIIRAQQEKLAAEYAKGGKKVGKAAKKEADDLGKLGRLDLGPLPKFKADKETETWLDKFEKAFRRLQLALSQAQLTASLQDDLAALKAMEDSIRRQLALHKDNIDLQEKLVDVLGQEKDLQKQIADAQKARIAARQFRQLGLTASGDEMVPGVKGLRKLLGNFERGVEGTFLDTKKTRTVISRIRKVLSGGLGAVGRDVRQKIKEILADLDQQLKDHAGDQTKFRHANTAKLLAGLGLSPDQLRAVRARVATIGPNGVVPGTASPAYAGATYTGPIHVHGVRDPRDFEEKMRKRQRSRPKRRRGT